MNKIWQFIRRIGLEVYCFITAPLVVKNCLGMFSFLGAIFMLTLWWLHCYTNHNEHQQVPNYTGISLKEAARKAHSADFNVAITDSIYQEGKAPGEVISQNPAPGSQVKEGRTIYFTVAKGKPDLITLPPLAGSDDYDVYSRKLARLGVKTRILSRVPDPSQANTILAVVHRSDTITAFIKRGYKIEMGATLDFIISEPSATDINIPDCTCLTFDAARFLISSSNLRVGAVIKDASVSDPLTAWVWKQSPAYEPDGTMKIGASIDLFLTQEQPTGCGR